MPTTQRAAYTQRTIGSRPFGWSLTLAAAVRQLSLVEPWLLAIPSVGSDWRDTCAVRAHVGRIRAKLAELPRTWSTRVERPFNLGLADWR